MSTRSRIATRRAAAELAGHRRRLLECAVEPDLDPADAMLLRVEPTAHRPGLARIAEAPLAVGAVDSHTEPKSAAGQSRPPEFDLAHNGTLVTDVSPPPARSAADLPAAVTARALAAASGPAATAGTTDLHLAPSPRIRGGEGESNFHLAPPLLEEGQT